MNSPLSTLERPTALLQINPVLTENGFRCTVLTLEPGAESTLPASASRDDQLLFVLDGDISVHAAGLTTVVNRGGASLLAPGEEPVVSARAGAPARLLRVEIPPRQVITPQIITPRT